MSKTLYPNSIRIGLLDPSIAQIWAQRILSDGTTVPSIKKGDTINHTTSQPIASGLFCQRIFGPCIDYTCACGHEKIQIGFNPNISAPVCPECRVEWTDASVRRQFLGSIDLISPVTHKWFSDSRNYIPILLGMTPRTFRDLKECKVFYPFSLEKHLLIQKKLANAFPEVLKKPILKKKASTFRALETLQFLIDPKKALTPNLSEKTLKNASDFPSNGLVPLTFHETSKYGLTTKKYRFCNNNLSKAVLEEKSNVQRKTPEFLSNSKDKNFFSLIAITETLTMEYFSDKFSKKSAKEFVKKRGNQENKKENKEIISKGFLKKENVKNFNSKTEGLFKETTIDKTIGQSLKKPNRSYLEKRIISLKYVFLLAKKIEKRFSDEFLSCVDEKNKVSLNLESKILEDNKNNNSVLPLLKDSSQSKGNSKITLKTNYGAVIFRDFTKYKLKQKSLSLFGKKYKLTGLLLKHTKNWTEIKKLTKIKNLKTISNYKIGLLSNSKVGLYRNLNPFTFNLLFPQKNRGLKETFKEKPVIKEKNTNLSYFQCCFLLSRKSTRVWYLQYKETFAKSSLKARFRFLVNHKKQDNPFFKPSVSLQNLLLTKPLNRKSKIVLKKHVYVREHNLPTRPSYTQPEDYRRLFVQFLGNKAYIEKTDLPIRGYNDPSLFRNQKQKAVKNPTKTTVVSTEAIEISFSKAKSFAKEEKIREILSQTGGGGLQTYLKLINVKELVLILQNELSEIPGPLAQSRKARRIWLLTLNKFLANFSKAALSEKLSVLEKRLKDIKKEYNTAKKICNSFQNRKNTYKRRYKLAFQFCRTMSNPTGMTMSSVPVLPPGLRPIIDVPKIGPITADLNIRYRSLLFALRNLRELAYVDFRNTGAAQASVQEAVDDLLYTGGKTKRDKPSSQNPNLYKSLAMRLKGKHGRFRGNLLGKRVDYSGRSVIVVGPTLKLHQCGLPFEIALKLFNPFLIRKLIQRGFCKNIYKAKQILLRGQFKPLIWTLCQEVMAEHLILLNRAPTLHRLGVQAFMPILVSGRAILLHPLVCTGFNADFDGDQMGVHVPLFPQARAEAWKMMWSRNNFLLPSSGEPVLLPSQDMVLGCYYLTCSLQNALYQKNSFSSFQVLNPQKALNSYEKGLYGVQSILWINPNKITGKENLYRSTFSPTEEFQTIEYDGSIQPTLELRITSFGIMRLLHTGGIKSFAFQNSVLLPSRQSGKPPVFALFVRTTIGRLIFNNLLQDIETLQDF